QIQSEAHCVSSATVRLVIIHSFRDLQVTSLTAASLTLHNTRSEIFQRTFPISFLIQGVNARRARAAMIGTAASLLQSPTSASGDPASKWPAAMPAAKLPNEIERNQTPIISPARRCGASFVVVLRPTGYQHISPIVCSA